MCVQSSAVAFMAFISSGDLFAELSAGLAADDVNRRPARDLVKPRGENGVGLQPGGVAREVDEDGLGDFLGELR